MAPLPPAKDGNLVRTGDMAARLQCSVATLRRMVNDETLSSAAGSVYHTKKGGYLRFDPEAVFRELRTKGKR